MRKILFLILSLSILCCNVLATFVPEPVSDAVSVSESESPADPEPAADLDFAADPEPVADPEPAADPEPVADPEPPADPEPAADPEPVADPESIEDSQIVFDPVLVSVSSSIDDGRITNVSLMSLNPVTPSDTSGLKSVLLDLLGDYDAVVVEYEYENNNGYTSYVREIQPDYVWLCSCGLFAIVVYCVFRLGGALLRD